MARKCSWPPGFAVVLGMSAVVLSVRFAVPIASTNALALAAGRGCATRPRCRACRWCGSRRGDAHIRPFLQFVLAIHHHPLPRGEARFNDRHSFFGRTYLFGAHLDGLILLDFESIR